MVTVAPHHQHRAAGGSRIEALAALAALRSMLLIGPDREKLSMLPAKKSDPMNDITFRKIQAIRNYALVKG